jgi:hypothetical protein
MFFNIIFQRLFVAANVIIEVFLYKDNYVLPYYNTDLDNNNNNNNNNNCKRCLDGDMDSVFFV